MTGTPESTTLADWAAAVARGLRPGRWLLCAAGLALTVLLAAEAQAWLERQPASLSGWWERPAEEAHALWAAVSGLSLARAVACVGAFLVVSGAGWCLVGAWVARDELLARREGGLHPGALSPGPTMFIFERGKALLQCGLLPPLLTLLPLLVVLFAGGVNAWLGGVGAVVVAVCLPAVLVATVILVCITAGAAGWPLMPVAVAAERGDCFDALSRAYNYVLQRPLRWLTLTAASLALTGLPLAALRYPLAEPLEALSPEGQRVVFWLVAALSASVFWSLQTMVYLDLRTETDAVDAGEVAVEEPPGRAYKQAPSGRASAPPAPAVLSEPSAWARVTGWARGVALILVSWWVIVWLLGLAGGDAAWLAWGVGDSFTPQVTGLHRAASLIAGFWGVFIGAALLMMFARRLRGGPRPLTAPGVVRQ